MKSYFFAFGSCLSCRNRITGEIAISTPAGETIRTREACRVFLLPENCQRDNDTAMCIGWKPDREAL